jgi:hypothetical protein
MLKTIRSAVRRFVPVCAALLASSVALADGTTQVVRIGERDVSLPAPTSFAPACQQDQRFAAGIAAMTPADSRLMACWVESGAWEAVKSGKAKSAYPAMFVTYAEKLGDDWTQAEFDKLKALARQQLPSLMSETAGAADQVRRQNEALAKENIQISSELLRRRYSGIFDVRTKSFSYLIFREAKVTTHGSPALSQETMAITTMLHRGSVIALTVVEQSMSEQSAASARRKSIAWLEQFRLANGT